MVNIIIFGILFAYLLIKNAVGGMETLVDKKSKAYEAQFMAYIADDSDKEERLLENPGMFVTPIVRNGKIATVGYQPDIWDSWQK